jgi:hypothetical protein
MVAFKSFKSDSKISFTRLELGSFNPLIFISPGWATSSSESLVLNFQLVLQQIEI